MFPEKYSICFNRSFSETVMKCDFKKRILINCKIETIEVKENEPSYFDTYDWIEFLKVCQQFIQCLNHSYTISACILNKFSCHSNYVRKNH